ncbi:MarR family transcriptional regulator [Synechococcus sp. BA-132 BA5]|uniref:MarR family transcriptional regulator n=1 Tax=Synechococcus sp. BA-132 BA5 TaxID=3110252 RepID=UPI002B1FFCDF|nr:MarR family transcriptional regulator [Synechococcus sp. BA-132 BA5]MEA5416710.1 MarR family transcriptional regulator [Synechococcus sp. BA-132 BA5]
MAVTTDLKLSRLQKVTDRLRLFDNELPAQVMSVLFYIAAHNGCRTTEMPKALNLAQSSISRCTDWLSDYHRLGKPGMGLIRKVVDSEDKRSRRVYLTYKGECVIEDIKDIVWGSDQSTNQPTIEDND